MSQNWESNCFQTDHVAAIDLQFIEDNFACLKSMFSGSSSPPSNVPGMTWFNTDEKNFCLRNYDNNDWFMILYGTTATKVWKYRNSGSYGWAVDSSVTDKVIAIKGGSYGDTGGTSVGTWTQPDHTLTIAELPSHRHTYTGHSGGVTAGATVQYLYLGAITTATDGGGGGAHNHGNTWRPAAAVGTLQYIDI
jgi:hypothetical protein